MYLTGFWQIRERAKNTLREGLQFSTVFVSYVYTLPIPEPLCLHPEKNSSVKCLHPPYFLHAVLQFISNKFCPPISCFFSNFVRHNSTLPPQKMPKVHPPIFGSFHLHPLPPFWGLPCPFPKIFPSWSLPPIFLVSEVSIPLFLAYPPLWGVFGTHPKCNACIDCVINIMFLRPFD